jgi:DNA-binding MarR family transcriptional regulator
MADLDTGLLRAFVALAETLSFSRTAERIGRSQSAVSMQIRRLEEILGCALFRRDKRNVALTAEGEALLGDARRILSLSEAMVARVRAPEVAGEVRFASPEDFATQYLPEILAAFAAKHPQVRLHVTCDLTLRLVEALGRGEQDLIVVKQDPAEPYPGSRALWRERPVFVARGARDRWRGSARDRWRGSARGRGAGARGAGFGGRGAHRRPHSAGRLARPLRLPPPRHRSPRRGRAALGHRLYQPVLRRHRGGCARRPRRHRPAAHHGAGRARGAGWRPGLADPAGGGDRPAGRAPRLPRHRRAGGLHRGARADLSTEQIRPIRKIRFPHLFRRRRSPSPPYGTRTACRASSPPRPGLSSPC